MKIKPYSHTLASLISGVALISLTACSSIMSSKMPAGSVSMEQAYTQAINGTDELGNDSNKEELSNTQTEDDSLKHVRAKIRGLKNIPPDYRDYTRTQENEITSRFKTLPNPNIVMYIYPHQAGIENQLTPIPGYATVFPLYTHVHYAMPGENMEPTPPKPNENLKESL